MKKNDRSCEIDYCKSCYTKKNKQICLMCNEGFFYYKNTCLKKCPNYTIELDNNNICLDKIDCGVHNCEKCIHKTKCTKCEKDLKVFKFCNRYSNSNTEENNTLIDLKFAHYG